MWAKNVDTLCCCAASYRFAFFSCEFNLNQVMLQCNFGWCHHSLNVLISANNHSTSVQQTYVAYLWYFTYYECFKLRKQKTQKKFKSMSFENDFITQHGGLWANQILRQNGSRKLERHCDYQFQSFFGWQEIAKRHLRI